MANLGPPVPPPTQRGHLADEWARSKLEISYLIDDLHRLSGDARTRKLQEIARYSYESSTIFGQAASACRDAGCWTPNFPAIWARITLEALGQRPQAQLLPEDGPIVTDMVRQITEAGGSVPANFVPEARSRGRQTSRRNR
ncbi:hypothetical protein JCM5350_004715 [Sporobolomyces pararoseus]